jgi:hypothetical protein
MQGSRSTCAVTRHGDLEVVSPSLLDVCMSSPAPTKLLAPPLNLPLLPPQSSLLGGQKVCTPVTAVERVSLLGIGHG